MWYMMYPTCVSNLNVELSAFWTRKIIKPKKKVIVFETCTTYYTQIHTFRHFV
jgi:hypothetical protein